MSDPAKHTQAGPLGQWLRRLYMALRGKSSEARRFEGSTDYWEQRYAAGGNSGAGSYRELAEFKADVLNTFVAYHGIQSVIELGCGDGNQLSLANYPSYTGYDISNTVLESCRTRYADNPTRRFRHVDEHAGEQAELSLSLDVIYHLVEDDVFEAHMAMLFDTASRYVIVYSSNSNENSRVQSAHVRHRRFSDWIDANRPDWTLVKHIPNRHPSRGLLGKGSFADFYIYSRAEAENDQR